MDREQNDGNSLIQKNAKNTVIAENELPKEKILIKTQSTKQGWSRWYANNRDWINYGLLAGFLFGAYQSLQQWIRHEDVRLYGEKSGTVVYKPMEMMGVKVTQTMFFDDYGKKTLRETIVEGNMNGVQMKQHTFDITDGFTMYHYETENVADGQDKTTKSVYKSTLVPEMFELMNIASLSDKIKTKVNFKDEGEETVAGLAGTKYSMSPDSANPDKRITGVHYKNIPLKVSFGEMQIIAEKVDFDSKVPADKFKVPEGYSLMDQSAPSMQQLPEEAPATAEPNKK